MAGTAAIQFLSHHFLGNTNPAVGLRNKIVQADRAYKRSLNAATEVPTLPPPPRVIDETAQAAQAAAQAAAIQRRRAENAGGYGSTILTSPSGAGPAVTTRKRLLGE